MRKTPYRVPVRWLFGIAGIGFVALLFLGPWARPHDSVRVITLSPRYNKLQRYSIMSKSEWRPPSYLPKYVELQSNGPKFRAYLVDLRPIKDGAAKVQAFMTASEEIERGEEPTSKAVIHRSIDAPKARFDLHSFPFGWRAHYMLIVFSNEDIEVTVRVSYGR